MVGGRLVRWIAVALFVVGSALLVAAAAIVGWAVNTRVVQKSAARTPFPE